ncbi:hypothetical protein QVD17_11891 [Tagetes erecta]|uniref:Uncharacterized protein n=1 Tax=Tagetes erecta TaxID=13708 RepID=A0AAD8P2G7_TARER|nr:hypothetical protein QVD17_11891 [Tagetes erecta]
MFITMCYKMGYFAIYLNSSKTYQKRYFDRRHALLQKCVEISPPRRTAPLQDGVTSNLKSDSTDHLLNISYVASNRESVQRKFIAISIIHQNPLD